MTWSNTGSVPHVIVFGGYLPPAESVDTPPTRPSGSSLPPGLFTTGPIGAPPYPRTSFQLRFDETGSYSYVCTLHPGMAGTVTVDDRRHVTEEAIPQLRSLRAQVGHNISAAPEAVAPLRARP